MTENKPSPTESVGDEILAAHLSGTDPSSPPRHVRAALWNAMGFALVDVRVNRQEPSIRPAISAEQALGFSLYLLKAVLNRQGDEVIDLGRTNLFR